MATEIERKFLVVGDAWRADVAKSKDYRQGYLVAEPPTTVRVRVDAGGARLNIKIGDATITREEFEYAIPVDDAAEMLDRHCRGAVIEKTRYYVPYAGFTWEIDVFAGDNAGLVVAEVELADENQAFDKPPWAGDEVSDDPRYYNVALVTHPYRDWDASD